jgi:hypothetical protein
MPSDARLKGLSASCLAVTMKYLVTCYIADARMLPTVLARHGPQDAAEHLWFEFRTCERA